ncbi:hypothetical protein Gohar_026583 [Gossypium harknessii]|uniref:Uncharacterized protein n=1 Tax=Gossypium harknessii TaxID=34285 RepID=A0A7J9HTE8_9ROSI|nr:hypothetical protein [Gossypium harknessii]
MAEDINAILERLKFLEEELVQVIQVVMVHERGGKFCSPERSLQHSFGTLDRQTALDVGNAIGELVAIDWKDRNGGWTKFLRLKIKINVSNPLRRVVKLVGKMGWKSYACSSTRDY